MQLNSRGRKSLRTLVAAGAVLGSLAGAGSAQAALDGANPTNFTDAPDLLSVTVNDAFATFTFRDDIKPVGGLGAGDFRLGGYESDFLLNTVLVPIIDGNQVIVPVDNPDEDELTFGTVLDNVVREDSTNGAINVADSTLVTGAQGQSGTRGHTVSCDLTGAIPSSGPNIITFVFDSECEEVTAKAGANQFRFLRSDGSVENGDSVASVSGNEVRVVFDAGSPVSQATEAFVNGGFLESINASIGNITRKTPPQNVDVAGSATGSDRAYIVKTEVVSPTEIEFTFNTEVSILNPLGFRGVTADTQLQPSVGAVLKAGDSKTVIANFVTNQFTEYLVYGSALAGAVRNNDLAIPVGTASNLDGGRPSGGNATALATGYTDAPDVQNVDFGANKVTITLDSRIRAVGPPPNKAQFDLLGADGLQIGGPPSNVSILLNGTPGPSVVEAFYGGNAATNARAFQLEPNAVRSTTPDASGNIVQTIGR